MTKTMIVHGPKGCGKTFNSKSIAAFYGCIDIIDDWLPGAAIYADCLHLTYQRPDVPKPNTRTMTFQRAMEEMRENRPDAFEEKTGTLKPAPDLAPPFQSVRRLSGDDEPLTCADAAALAPVFKSGDVVRLKSCFVPMTVICADCCEVEVVWFDGTMMQNETLPLSCINEYAGECPF
ncbi:hypothetical protein [Roseobacter litoralis]|uniref:hypothetical protein n=1 Tax=Roseobacter litoralis TaxID=42443 RepID=UPI00249556DB|nr:hypothetical protein [Roseobacter litoralis]